jgi:cytochrome b561
LGRRDRKEPAGPAWDLPTRWFHWINALAVIGLIASGIVILNDDTLGRTQHNVSKAARLAGIDRNYLYRMMKKHGIARKE